MINMSKIANDLRLMASGPRTGLAEITLPARQPGSSIMPGKVNPVMAEVINQVAFQVMGNDHTICLASEAGQFELNVMEPVLVFNLLQSIDIMTNVFTAFNNYCLDGIEANVERWKHMWIIASVSSQRSIRMSVMRRRAESQDGNGNRPSDSRAMHRGRSPDRSGIGHYFTPIRNDQSRNFRERVTREKRICERIIERAADSRCSFFDG